MKDTLENILHKLAEPVPGHLIKTRSMGGESFSYIPWVDLVDLLDLRAPGWEYDINVESSHPHQWTRVKNGKEIHKHGQKVICKASITIHGNDGSITRSSLGYENPEETFIGDEATNSEATALRRTCGKLGLGRDLWRKDTGRNNNAPAQSQSTRRNTTSNNHSSHTLSPDQMIDMLTQSLESGYQLGAPQLRKSITSVNKRLGKLPQNKREEMKALIGSFQSKLEAMS